jgi:hypothetical protein
MIRIILASTLDDLQESSAATNSTYFRRTGQRLPSASSQALVTATHLRLRRLVKSHMTSPSHISIILSIFSHALISRR